MSPPLPGSRHVNNMPLPGAFQFLEHWPSDRWVFLTFLTFDLATCHSDCLPLESPCSLEAHGTSSQSAQPAMMEYHTLGAQTQGSYFLHFWRLEAQAQGTSRFGSHWEPIPGLHTATFPPCPHTVERASVLGSLSLLLKALIPS